MKTVIYSLRTINDKSTLSIDLTGFLVPEKPYTFEIKLPSGDVFLDRKEYLDTGKIYDDGNVFFVLCGYKKFNRKTIFKLLMNHAISKLKKRVNNIQTMIHKFESEIAA